MKASVLVVAENVNERIISETLLRARGFRVTMAADGVEAYEMAQIHRPEVVILDLALSGMNGWELIRRLRGRFEPLPLAARPRIVALAGRVEAETEAFTMRLGADVVLRKPILPGEFLEAVEQLGRAGADAPMRAAG